MQKYYNNTQDSNGNALNGASVEVFDGGTSNQASLFEDDQTTPLANPVTSDADGVFSFKAANGEYNYIVTKGATVRPRTCILLFDEADSTSIYDGTNVTITGGTIVNTTVDGRDVGADGAILENLAGDAGGIEGHDDALVSLNTDITKLDIAAATYFIQGVKYTYAGGTAVLPTIAAADTSTWVGLDASGLNYSAGAYTDVQKRTILPIARLQAVAGDSGPASQLQEPIDLRYTIGEEAWVNEVWLATNIGVLHPRDGNDGIITENATSLRLDQASGTVYDAQRKDFAVPSTLQITALSLYHVAGVWTLQADATVVTPLYYDDGTDIVALPVGKWAAHTLLRSPKGSDSFALVYSQAQYNSQAEAEAAGAEFGLFVSQEASTFYPVANIIVKGNSTAVESIVDLRPKIGANAGSIIGTATLQQIYENSITPELTTDSTRGALSIKGGVLDTDNNLEILDTSGALTAYINGDGIVGAQGGIFNEVAAPATPSATNVALYAKIDGLLYSKDDAGVESPVSRSVESFIAAASDETTALTVGTGKTTFRMPYAFTITEVRASVTTAPTGSAITVDINESGVSILSTKLTIDATEKTSETAAIPPVISDATIADDAEITIDIDVIGSTVAGAGLKITLIGERD